MSEKRHYLGGAHEAEVTASIVGFACPAGRAAPAKQMAGRQGTGLRGRVTRERVTRGHVPLSEAKDKERVERARLLYAVMGNAALKKLRLNADKGDWLALPLDELLRLLDVEIQELKEELKAQDVSAENVLFEVADCMNFLAFVLDKSINNG